MRIYCLSLEECHERRRNILEECGKYGLEVEFINAVDGKKLSEQTMLDLVFDPQHTMLTAGEIGCALSHIKAYEKLLADECSMAFILEDDAVFKLNPRPFLEAAALADPQQPDVFLISENKKYLAHKGRQLGGIMFYPIFHAQTAHAYIITRAAACNLALFLKPVRFVANCWKYFARCGVVNVWTCNEVFVAQERNRFASTLSPDREPILHSPKRKRFLRRINSMMPLSNRIKYVLWRLFIKPFIKISK